MNVPIKDRRKAEDAIIRCTQLYSLFDLKTLSDARIAELYQTYCLPPVQEKSNMSTLEEIQERVRWAQANADNPIIHTVTRNDRLYDRMCPAKYATTQITHSYSRDMPGDTWRLWDEKAEMLAELRTITPIQEKRK